MALGLTIGFVIYLAWKSNYLRELRRFVRVAVDLIYVLITAVQYGIQGAAEPPGPVPMDIHEGRSSDDTANSRARIPIPGPMDVYEGSDSDDMDTHEDSSSDDGTAVIATGPTGSWLVMKQQWKSPRSGCHVRWASSADEGTDTVSADQVAADVAGTVAAEVAETL